MRASIHSQSVYVHALHLQESIVGNPQRAGHVPCQLCVHVLECRNLKKMDRMSGNDVFVVVAVDDGAEQRCVFSSSVF